MSKRINISVVFILAMTVSLFITSCGNFGHNNFNKRKYTNLKSAPTFENQTDESLDLSSDESIPLNVEIEKEEALNSIVSIEYSDNKSTREVDLDFDETTADIKEELAIVEEISQTPPPFENRRNFHKLSEHEKNRALINFNWIFNAGLGIILFALFLGILAFVSIFTSQLWVLGVVFGALAGALVFIAWIMSLVALNQIRRIRKVTNYEYSYDFHNKVGLARLVAFLGIATCVVTVFGGVILLLLWAIGVL